MTNELQSIHWQDVELEEVNESMRRRIVTGEKMTVARIYFDDGFMVPMHSHHNEQITQVVKGQMQFVFGDDQAQELLLNPGDVVVRTQMAFKTIVQFILISCEPSECSCHIQWIGL